MSAPGYSLRRDWLLWTLLGVFLLLCVRHPGQILSYPVLVNWPTMETLAGLLLLTGGVEASGFLHRLAARITQEVHDQRSLALSLVTASAVLAALLTNDIALFIVVPLTLTLTDYATLPMARLVAFEALAVNTGSMLTPIGNPQNIFLWQSSGVRFFGFMQVMLPPTLIAASCLLLFIFIAFRPRPIVLQPVSASMQVRWRLFALSASLFAPFILAADLRHADWALLVVASLFLALDPTVLRRLDWPLLLVFLLMFVDLRLLAGLPMVATWLDHLNLQHPGNLYLTAAGLSQLISNVPTTILLSTHSTDWRTLAWGVDMGGFGLALGSLANLIALRLAGARGSFLVFHAWATPFLLLAGGLGYLWLVTGGGQ